MQYCKAFLKDCTASIMQADGFDGDTCDTCCGRKRKEIQAFVSWVDTKALGQAISENLGTWGVPPTLENIKKVYAGMLEGTRDEARAVAESMPD